MKLLIACDMEGISGVTRWEHCSSDQSEYQRFRLLMTEDVNSVIEGAFSGGADEVLVADGHNRGQNLLIEKLNPRVRHNNGTFSPWSMMNGIESGVDAVIFVGYHAKAGSADAILAHTWQTNLLDLRINNKSIGEFGLNSMIAGYFHAPVLMVSGDQTLAAEASALVPGVICTQVKQASGYFSGTCLTPTQTKEMLRHDAKTALISFLAGKAPQPLTIPGALNMEVEFSMPNLAEAAARLPGAERKSGRCVSMVCKDVPQMFASFRCLCNLAS